MIGNQTSTLAVTESSEPAIAEEPLKISFKPYDRLRSAIGMRGIALACGGVLLTVVCAAWAVAEGAAVPMVILAGYGALIATVALVALIHVLIHLLNAADTAVSDTTAASVSQLPNYAAWKIVSKLNIANASRLWCGIEPGHPYSQESMAWSTAMLDAVRTGALPIAERPNVNKDVLEREKANPTWHTEVTREALKAWATSNGHSPEFLRD